MAVNESTGQIHAPSIKLEKIKKDSTSTNDRVKVADHDDLNNTLLVGSSLIAGATAGAFAKTAIAPLDRTKINFQIQKAPFTMDSAVSFLVNTFKSEGLIALWRGNSATLMRIVPYSAIQFTAHEQWKRLLGVNDPTVGHNHQLKLFVAGSLAGITSQSLTYPLDLARARMAVSYEYTKLRHVFVSIVANEGALTMYRGYVATVLGVIPYAGVSFFTYDTLKHTYNEYFNEKPHALVNLVFGGIAGMLGQTSSYPLDIVRRRMQTSKRNPDGTFPYNSILGTLKKIYSEEGVKNGLYKGLSLNWIKGPIAVGISFATYDYIKHGLRDLALSLGVR